MGIMPDNNGESLAPEGLAEDMPSPAAEPSSTDKALPESVSSQASEDSAESKGKTEAMIPYARFKQQNEKLRAVEGELKHLKAELRKRAEQELAQQEQWRELAEQREQEIAELSKQVEELSRLRDVVASAVEARIDSLPERLRSLVPDYNDPAKTLAWLEANASLLSPAQAPNLDPGMPSPPKPKPKIRLTDLQREVAAAMRISEEDYIKHLEELGKH